MAAVAATTKAKTQTPSLEICNHLFLQMHTVPCDYERREYEDVLPLKVLREYLDLNNNMRIGTYYDRPPLSLPSAAAGGNNSFANGIGAGSFVKPGQILTPVKFLCRLSEEEKGLDSPVFFFAYRNYNNKLAKLTQELKEECMIIKDEPEYKVNHILLVSLGGLFVLKSKFGEDFIRIRVTKILLDTQSLQYWAVDEAFFGTCEPTDLLFINERLAEMDMLAVPGIFETDPRPTQLAKFEGDGKPYCMARLWQPKYSCDFGPRKISFM